MVREQISQLPRFTTCVHKKMYYVSLANLYMKPDNTVSKRYMYVHILSILNIMG